MIFNFMSNDKKEKKQVYKNPPPLEETIRSVYKPTGLGDKNYKGTTKEGQEEKYEWGYKGVVARYPKSKQEKIDRKKKKPETALSVIPTPPKLGVSHAKNIYALGFMLQQENWRREKDGKERLAELEFSLKDYAEARRNGGGEQVARGGKFLDELKRDLFTGAYTTYRLDKVIIDGKKYTRHGIPNFYILDEPEDKKAKWRITFNEPYKDYYLNGKQYYPILLEAIKDKNTNGKKGFLFSFFVLVMRYAGEWKSKGHPPVLKVSTLLENIKADDRTQTRPQEAFKVLAECIYYTATHYKAIKEVRFFDSGKCEKVKVITDLEKFKSWIYEDFKKEVLTPLGLDDIREALISFNVPPEAKPERTEETGQTGQDETSL